MIKFFHKILIFLFEKITPSSTFNANSLSDFVHTFFLKSKRRLQGTQKSKILMKCAPLCFAQDTTYPFLAFKIEDFNKLGSYLLFCPFIENLNCCSYLLLKSSILTSLAVLCCASFIKIKDFKRSLAVLCCASCSLKSKILTSLFFLSTFFSFNKVGDCLRFLFLLPNLLKSNILKARNLKISGPWFFTSFYFVFMLILPIFSLLNAASKNLFDHFWETATEPVALSAYTVTISMAFFACIFNAFFGFILAWVLVRYNFPGKRLLDAAVDLPFALPTSVAGLTLATVYSDQGWIGSFLSTVGIQIVFTKLGILIAMIFVSFPFVVRTLQPVLQEMEIELEEAAWSLGASPWKTFRKVIFPPLIPAILTGLTLAFSRAIGEYGSIVIVSSNIPLKDLIASVLIFQNLEQYDYTRATVIGTVVLLLSLFLLLGINFLQSWNQKYLKF